MYKDYGGPRLSPLPSSRLMALGADAECWPPWRRARSHLGIFARVATPRPSHRVCGLGMPSLTLWLTAPRSRLHTAHTTQTTHISQLHKCEVTLFKNIKTQKILCVSQVWCVS